MENIKVRELTDVVEKPKAEIEQDLLNKHEEKFEQTTESTEEKVVIKDEQEAPVEEKVEEKTTEVEEKTPAPELSDADVLTYIKNRYDKDINSVDDLFAQQEVNEDLPEDVSAYFKYKKETGRGIEDFYKLQKDYDTMDDDLLLADFYGATEEGLDAIDIQDLMDDKFSYDEEIGCVGIHRLIDLLSGSNFKPTLCIVGEPTNMEVVIGHKGKSGHEVEVKGLACHSGQAPLGVNAINYAAKLISFISDLAKDKSNYGPFDYDYEIPYTTLHTGVISGGTVVNIVPETCNFELSSISIRIIINL